MIDVNERQAVITVPVDELWFGEENTEENLQPQPAKKAAFQDFAEWEDADTMNSDVPLHSKIFFQVGWIRSTQA